MKIKLETNNLSGKVLRLEKGFFEGWLKNTIHSLKFLGEGRIEFSLVTDLQIQKLNKQFRGLNKPTDVLSLEYKNQQNCADDLLGEIFISVDTAKKQAVERSVSLKKELSFLFVHGLLHVFGYDHLNKKDYLKMFKTHQNIMPDFVWNDYL
jgi:probable rRNA maturation factor